MIRFLGGACVAIVALVLVAGPASAKQTPEEHFKKLDKDKNKKLTLSEVVGQKEGEAKSKAQRLFRSKDKNNDGKVTLEEFKGKGKKNVGGKKR